MAHMTEQTYRCGKQFLARTVDINRGWGKSCSKSCAASKSNKETGKYRKLMGRTSSFRNNEYDNCDPHENAHPFSSEALGQD